MTYYIYYKERTNILFDIEYYLTECDDKGGLYGGGLWYSEISVQSFINGLINYVMDSKELPVEKIKEFVKDATEIQELRGLLNERHDNTASELNNADKRHREFRTELKGMLDNFCSKYHLELGID